MAKLKRREFKPLNTKRVKEGAARTNSKYDSTFKSGVNTLKMKVGVNNLRIVRGTDAEYFGETIWVHSYVGVKESSYICPKKMNKAKKCPICDAMDDAVAAGDKEEAAKLSAKERMICYTVNRDDEKAGLQVWDMSWSQGREIDAVCDTRRGILDISHPDTGFDISIQRTGTGKATRYVGLQVDRESSPLAENQRQQDAWIDEIDAAPLVDLLKYYPEDYLGDILTGKVEEKDEGDTDEVEEKGPRRRDSRDREEDDDDQDTRPTRTTGRRGTREEEEERPAQRTRARSAEAGDADDHEAAEANRWREREARKAKGDEEEDHPVRRSRRDELEEEEEAPRHRRRAAANGEDDGPPPRETRRNRRNEPDEDEHEQPTARRRREPEEEDHPVRRSRRDEPEEEERPTRRQRERNDEDGEEESRPVRRGRREQPEEDERPAQRRRERSDEEEDPAPQRSRR